MSIAFSPARYVSRPVLLSGKAFCLPCPPGRWYLKEKGMLSSTTDSVEPPSIALSRKMPPRSSLVVSTGPKTYHPVVHEATRDLSEIIVEGRTVRLFWVRVHAGITGNERPDELARRAALTKKTAANYNNSIIFKDTKLATDTAAVGRLAKSASGVVNKAFGGNFEIVPLARHYTWGNLCVSHNPLFPTIASIHISDWL
ncbi:hypothetical protein EVAR_79897_1 [Eumeta japonica]|uniref:RNase H type-1 domain-containing protein n=1 Tax=Eumeta variegata TaxID=151549 RepID=A0A4C1TZ65_EUMVA|nr:hypothetical protein EVAR_79897_1 [Eumeta japonica]